MTCRSGTYPDYTARYTGLNITCTLYDHGASCGKSQTRQNERHALRACVNWRIRFAVKRVNLVHVRSHSEERARKVRHAERSVAAHFSQRTQRDTYRCVLRVWSGYETGMLGTYAEQTLQATHIPLHSADTCTHGTPDPKHSRGRARLTGGPKPRVYTNPGVQTSRVQ